MKSKKQILHLDKLAKMKRGRPSPLRGRALTDLHKQRIAKSSVGRIWSIKSRKKASISHSGERSYRWKGGITLEHKKIRRSLEYKLWSDSIWNRDNHSCQKCGKFWNSNLNLTSHHILNFSSYPKLRLAIDNGITFCRPCHKEFHQKYGIKNNNKEQIEKFIKKL